MGGRDKQVWYRMEVGVVELVTKGVSLPLGNERARQ